jgi:hypothetical protein
MRKRSKSEKRMKNGFYGLVEGKLREGENGQ